jgi:hypothetical protein
MPRRKHKPEEIVVKPRQVDVLLSQGRAVAEAIRTIGVTPFTYYRWRKEFGGLKSDQVKRLKNLEKDRAIEAPLMEWMAPAPGVAMRQSGDVERSPSKGATHGRDYHHRRRPSQERVV